MPAWEMKTNPPPPPPPTLGINHNKTSELMAVSVSDISLCIELGSVELHSARC